MVAKVRHTIGRYDWEQTCVGSICQWFRVTQSRYPELSGSRLLGPRYVSSSSFIDLPLLRSSPKFPAHHASLAAKILSRLHRQSPCRRLLLGELPHCGARSLYVHLLVQYRSYEVKETVQFHLCGVEETREIVEKIRKGGPIGGVVVD